MRKGDVVIGAKRVIETLPKQKHATVFLAKDAGENTKKKILDKTTHYGFECIRDYTSEALSKAVGKKNITVLALTGEDLMKKSS